MTDNQLMDQLESLPSSLRYGARQLAVRINRNTNIVPLGTDSVTSNGSGVVRFRFPTASILNMSSISISFIATINGLTTGSTNYVNALIPASYKYIKRAQFYLGGVSCAGSLANNYNQIYHAFVKATGNRSYCESKVGSSYPEVSDLYDQFGDLAAPPPGTSKTAFQVLDDFLLLAKGNGASVNPDMMIDSSIWQDAELELNFDNNSILSIFADNSSGTNANATTVANAVSWTLTNIRLNVDSISSIPAIYGAFMEARSQRPEPIRIVFQNLVSQVSQILQTTRVQVSSGCIDGLMVCGLLSTFNTATAFIGNIAADTTIGITNPPKFNFTSGLSLTASNDTAAYTAFSASMQVGSALYPSTPYNSLYLLADSTLNHFWHSSIMARSLLYQNTLADVVSGAYTTVDAPFVNPNYGNNQFIWVQSFSLEDGWSSAGKILSGIDTSSTNVDILVQTNLANSSYSFLLIGLLSSVLEYDTQARRVRVLQ
jgi:hypothetical protein